MTEIITKLLKAITEFLGLSSALLKISEAVTKAKHLLVAVFALLFIIVLACGCVYLQGDGSYNHIIIYILFACFTLLFMASVGAYLLMTRKLKDAERKLEEDRKDLEKKHQSNVAMLSEEHNSAISILVDQHKRDMSDLTFKYNQNQRTILLSYYKLHRDFRNSINKIEKHHKDDPQNQMQTISVQVIQFIQDLLDYLSEVFSQLTGETISACVKTIVYKDFDNINYSEAYVRTFLRSKNTSKDRKTYHDAHPKSVKLSENTDFMEIVSDDRLNISSCFYQGNLPEYALSLKKVNRKYRNTTKNYTMFYNGTIVAPIRIANQYIFYTKEDEGYNTIGFLCVDSESVHAFPPDREEEYTNIMRAFAAILYNVLSKYQFYLADEQRRRNEQEHREKEKKRFTGIRKRN